MTTLFILIAQALAVTGKVYEMNNPSNLLFNYSETVIKKPGLEIKDTEFTNAAGKLAVSENIVYQNGKLSKYTIEQKQLGVTNVVDIKGNSVHYTRTNHKTGEVTSNDDSWGDNYVVIPQLISFTRANWDALMKGSKVFVRISIPEKMDTYGFYLSKSSEKTADGQTVFKIAPSSIFIAAVLNPFHVTFNTKDRKPLKFTGTGLPKLEKGPSDLRDVEADIIYVE